MTESTVSRRVSEFAGVALFALALIWLIALVTYEPTDPVWFFTTGEGPSPANFVGRVGAFLSELSFQMFGYASYLVPLAVGVAGWHYFWCQPPTAAYTKLVGVTLFFTCSSAFLSLLLGSTEVAGKTFHAGGVVGNWLGAGFSEYLNRTGAIIVLLTLMSLAVIVSTHFSFGTMFARASQWSRDLSARGLGSIRVWIERQRKARERRAVVARQSRKAAETGAAAARANADAPVKPAVTRSPDTGARPDRQAPPVVARRAPEMAPPLPLPDPAPKAAAPARQGAYTLPPPSLLDAPKAGQKIDERELMEAARQLEEKCREFSVEGQVAQIHPGPVVTTFEFKPEAGV